MKQEKGGRTVGVGGREHGALGDGAEELERGGAGALPFRAVAALRLPGVHRPQPHRHQDPLLLLLLPARHLLFVLLPGTDANRNQRAA